MALDEAGSTATLRDVGDPRSLKVVIPADVGDLAVALDGIGHLGDTGDAFLCIAALRDLAGSLAEDPGWSRAFEAMVEYAQSEGRVDGHGRALRAPASGGPDGSSRRRRWDTRRLSLKAKAEGVTIRFLESADDAAAFRGLNEEWIGRNFVFEERDRRQLDDPVAAYIDSGGAILIAELDGRPIGCVALVPDGTGAYELSKMAVSPELRGHGAGRKLLAAAIDHAQGLGARSLFLGSSKKLGSAVHLYEAFGFKHVPRDRLHLASTRVDVFMELVFEAA